MALLASSLLFPLALADGTLFPRHDNYVNQTSLESFQDWLGTANASATHEVQFPNIYQDAYPGDPDDEVKHIIWLRIDDETHDTAEQANAGIHPGDAPHAISENGTLNVNDTWAVCPSVTRFRDHGLPRDVPINRNCSNVFPEDCLAWLRNLGSGGNMCINAALGNPSPWKDSPCDGALDGDSTPRVLEAHAGGHPNRLFNWTLFSAPRTGTTGMIGTTGSSTPCTCSRRASRGGTPRRGRCW